MFEKYVDIRLTPDGDFELDSDKDIKLTDLSELVEQKIHIALKTSNPDWFKELIGADLEDLIGMEHTKETAEIGKQKIMSALTQHGFFDVDEVFVEAKPMNKTTILFQLYVSVEALGENQVYRIALDLGSGAQLRRVL